MKQTSIIGGTGNEFHGKTALQVACQSSKQSVPFCPADTAIIGVVEPKNVA